MKQSRHRLLYLMIGWIFTGLGFVGAFLPILPTTPFLLVAVWAFSKSSPKLRHWLFTHPQFGPYIRDWFEKGAISRKAKFFSLSMMLASVGFATFMSENLYVPITLGIIMLATGTFIVTRPSPSSIAVKSQQ